MTNININLTNLPNPSNPTLPVPAPTRNLAQRTKKINLNYPLPVSNDPNEPIRQKWISDTYQLLKAILPPRAVDTAEELAQLSQYVINIIDFRDPDSTMTHWVNPDVMLSGVLVAGAAAPTGATPIPTFSRTSPPGASRPVPAAPRSVRNGV